VRETRFAATLERAERERQRRRAATRARYDESSDGARGGDAANDGRVEAVRVEGVEMPQEQAHVERQDALEEELTQLLDQVRMAEKNVIEMSALSSLFATHVQAQAEQIESLYQDAIESSRHLDMGNVEMKKTIARKGHAQRYVAVILLIATLGLLFLDWYSG
jgi:syntaxin 18